jgi:hypothetical protein
MKEEKDKRQRATTGWTAAAVSTEEKRWGMKEIGSDERRP